MVNQLTEFLVIGKIPGTEATINFEAFLQGMFVGALTLLAYRLMANRIFKQKSNQAQVN